MAIFAPRPWKRRHVIGAALVILSLLTLTVRSDRAARLDPVYTAKSGSVGNRLAIWKCVPSMMADAPGGWGFGNAPTAFKDWYQDPDFNEDYITLVSTHLTWLPEFNRWEQLGYVAAWALAFRLTWPDRRKRKPKDDEAKPCRLSSVPLAIVTAFFTANCFSLVADVWQVWPVPVFAVIGMMAMRWSAHTWPRPLEWALWAGIPCATLMVVIAAYSGRSGYRVFDQGNTVILGRGGNTLVIAVGADAKESARKLRSTFDAAHGAGTMIWTKTPAAVSADHPVALAILGHPVREQIRPLIEKAPRILVFAPQYVPEELFAPADLKKVTAYTGEFSGSSATEAWRATGRAETLVGTADFVGDWAERLVAVV